VNVPEFELALQRLTCLLDGTETDDPAIRWAVDDLLRVMEDDASSTLYRGR
jgi:hypothetical protein